MLGLISLVFLDFLIYHRLPLTFHVGDFDC